MTSDVSHQIHNKNPYPLGRYVFVCFILISSILLLFGLFNNALSSSTSLLSAFFIIFLLLFSLVLTLQAGYSIYWMLYAWMEVDEVKKESTPLNYSAAKYSFTALLPVRHEEKVIRETLHAIAKIDYPDELKEIIVICRDDDEKTITKVKSVIAEIKNNNIKLTVFTGYPINKPHGLNIGLVNSKNEIIVIFDAEDQPHPDIYNIVNTVLITESADVVQSGVQLMDYTSSWFSSLNVLEYYFWFKSTLHYFSHMGIIPLGGNTVFFKKNWLEKVNGWDETCLTEDADIGIRLSVAGAKVSVVYDEKHVTQEETPPDLQSFIKQRTRWNQGFIQIFLKKDWLKLSKTPMKLLAAYILLLPQLQAVLFLLVPFSLFIIFTTRLPIIVTLLSAIPFALLLIQLLTYNVGLYLFTKSYNLRFTIWHPLMLTLCYIPYQFILGLSALRAMSRAVTKKVNWEKTHHTNAHRTELSIK